MNKQLISFFEEQKNKYDGSIFALVISEKKTSFPKEQIVYTDGNKMVENGRYHVDQYTYILEEEQTYRPDGEKITRYSLYLNSKIDTDCCSKKIEEHLSDNIKQFS